MSKQWGHGFYAGLAGRDEESKRLIEEYQLTPRNGETAQEVFAREDGYSEGWRDAMEMSLWQFFLARRAFKKSAETWQKLWRERKAY